MARYWAACRALRALLEPTGCLLSHVDKQSWKGASGGLIHATGNSLAVNVSCTMHTCAARVTQDSAWRKLQQSLFSRAGSSVAAVDVKKGMILSQHQGSKLLEVLQAFHSAGQARQGGFVSVDCRDVRTGQKSTMKLTPSKTVVVADTQWRRMQYLYSDEEGVHIMDAENFEQFCVPPHSAAGVQDWLQNGLEVSALMHDEAPVMVMMPQSQITVQVKEVAEARLSVASGRKPAVVNTGATVMVPSFVQKDEYIIVSPSSGEFVSRAKP